MEREGVSSVTRCGCWRQATATRAVGGARIPPRYGGCTLDNLLIYDNEQFLRAVDVARRFAESFPVVSKCLMLIGPPGIGKTHIAVAVLQRVAERTGARALYYDTRALLRDIRSTYDPARQMAEMDVIRPVMEAELLVLDDLGAERLTDWVEETMSSIANTRYNERRPTIFTSNYEDIPDGDDLNSLLVRVGFRLHSRLHEMCEFLEYDGPDYRKLPPNVSSEDLYKLWKGRPRGRLPARSGRQARAQLRRSARESTPEIQWPGGKAGTKR